MVLERLLSGSENEDSDPWAVVWTIRHDVDDYKGPGWYVSSPNMDSDEGGPFDSRERALEYASERARSGAVFSIWDRDEPDRPRPMYYNPTFDEANEYDLVASR